MKRARRTGSRRPDGTEPEQVLYSPQAAAGDGTVRVVGSEAEHAVRSLRLRSGDPVAVVNGNGLRLRGTLADRDREGLTIRVASCETLPRWPRRELRLICGVLRSTRMDLLVEKASELGVTRFVPAVMERSVARPDEAGTKLERWRRIAVESLKQSKRDRLMQVEDPLTLESALAAVPAGSVGWAADPEGGFPGDTPVPGPHGVWVLVVGPEGGLAPWERRLLEAAGFHFIRLGGNRLRSETATATLLVAALMASGELAAPSG